MTLPPLRTAQAIASALPNASRAPMPCIAQPNTRPVSSTAVSSGSNLVVSPKKDAPSCTRSLQASPAVLAAIRLLGPMVP